VLGPFVVSVVSKIDTTESTCPPNKRDKNPRPSLSGRGPSLPHLKARGFGPTGLQSLNKTNSGIAVTCSLVLLKLLGRLRALVFSRSFLNSSAVQVTYDASTIGRPCKEVLCKEFLRKIWICFSIRSFCRREVMLNPRPPFTTKASVRPPEGLLRGRAGLKALHFSSANIILGPGPSAVASVARPFSYPPAPFPPGGEPPVGHETQVTYNPLRLWESPIHRRGL
jgi:hypothetical protein